MIPETNLDSKLLPLGFKRILLLFLNKSFSTRYWTQKTQFQNLSDLLFFQNKTFPDSCRNFYPQTCWMGLDNHGWFFASLLEGRILLITGLDITRVSLFSCLFRFSVKIPQVVQLGFGKHPHYGRSLMTGNGWGKRAHGASLTDSL